MIAFAGVLGIGVAIVMMEIIDAYSVSRSAVSFTLATVVGAFGICVNYYNGSRCAANNLNL